MAVGVRRLLDIATSTNCASAWSRGSPRTRGRIAEAREELNLAMSLAELKHARELTQAQLAQALDVQQPAVSRIEHQTDLYLSTLRSYVEALGGELQIVAQFGATAVMLNGFEELDEAPDSRTTLSPRTQ